MRFSILTPSFNQGQFLDRHIRSVTAQATPGVEIEHIVIDGGSTDGSVEVLRRRDADLAYWQSAPDEGQSDALGQALNRATGDVVGWLNSDEFYLPGAIASVAEAFDRKPAAVLVYADYDRVTETGRLIRHTKSWRFDYDVCRVQTPIIMNCAAFLDRRRVVECGGFSRDYHYIMDWDLYTRFMTRTSQYVRLRRPLAQFTVHPESKTVVDPAAFADEISRMRAAMFPGWTEQAIASEQRRQYRRMQ